MFTHWKKKSVAAVAVLGATLALTTATEAYAGGQVVCNTPGAVKIVRLDGSGICLVGNDNGAVWAADTNHIDQIRYVDSGRWRGEISYQGPRGKPVIGFLDPGAIIAFDGQPTGYIFRIKLKR
ncbi:hypothetical protein AB0P21_39830 [Kribbella sp. NPDC056861]|uniref:hypothetical protein n=1 Tax=Kribbella sp. NPDC056861 TaxID=3154857 RepID=UPI0034158385